MTDTTETETDTEKHRSETTQYAITDANGTVIQDHLYEDADRTLDARALLMASHPDEDAVTVEKRPVRTRTTNSDGDE